jgi:hypothetical protein
MGENPLNKEYTLEKCESKTGPVGLWVLMGRGGEWLG